MDRLVGLGYDGAAARATAPWLSPPSHVERVPPSRRLSGRTEGELPRAQRRALDRSADQRADRLDRAEVRASQPWARSAHPDVAQRTGVSVTVA